MPYLYLGTLYRKEHFTVFRKNYVVEINSVFDLSNTVTSADPMLLRYSKTYSTSLQDRRKLVAVGS